jgi:hypothetical protein
MDLTKIGMGVDVGNVSDGFHTFNELYAHRNALFLLLCKLLPMNTLFVWRSKHHSDGSGYAGWFLLGMGKEQGTQITYHLPESQWQLCDFAETLDKAPEWDGHTP